MAALFLRNRVRARGVWIPVGMMVLAILSGCPGDGPVDPPDPVPTTLVLSPASVTLSYIGATTGLTARLLDQNGSPMTGTVTWASDDPGVATVGANGTVTAVANGSTSIRATSGSVSGTATVTVQQLVGRLTVLSGNAQSALAGEALAEAVVVRAEDLGGTAVAGATVNFLPDEGSGTVSAASVVTDDLGDASTVWTLGTGFGMQRLIVNAGGAASALVTATSMSPVPLADLVTAAALSVQRPDPSNLDTVRVEATVDNEGTASSGAFRVRLVDNGVEIASEDVADLAVGADVTVTFTVGPLGVGAHALRLEVDADAAVDELSEVNNTATKDVTVALLTPLAPGATLSGIGAQENVELLYRLDLPGAANNLTIELSGGTGDVDLFVEAGQRPSTREAYNDCQSGSPTTVERCQLSGVSAGAYYILLHAFSTFSGVTMTITLDGEVLPYNIEVVFVNGGTVSQQAAFVEAAERWMSLIPVDVTDSDFSAQPLAPGSCIDGQPEVNEIVDDLRIYVSIDSIDGASQVLARAAPCVTRGLGHLPILGIMEFDSTDIKSLEQGGELLPVVLHEMGHVLGLGTIWGLTDYLQNPSLPSNSGADTYFNGEGAVAAFDAAGGTSYTKGQKVPVENTADEGSADSHWRESVLRRELMTPFFNSGQSNPLSAITVRSLADLGYQVDVSGADPYSGSFTAPSPAPGVSRPVLDLSGDVIRRPVVVVDQKGRVLEIRR